MSAAPIAPHPASRPGVTDVSGRAQLRRGACERPAILSPVSGRQHCHPLRHGEGDDHLGCSGTAPAVRARRRVRRLAQDAPGRGAPAGLGARGPPAPRGASRRAGDTGGRRRHRLSRPASLARGRHRWSRPASLRRGRQRGKSCRMCTHGAISLFRTCHRTVIARPSRRRRDRGATRRARHARSRPVRCQADAPNGGRPASPVGRAPLEPTYGSPGAHPAGSAVGVATRADIRLPRRTSRRIRGRRASRRIRGRGAGAAFRGRGAGAAFRGQRPRVSPQRGREAQTRALVIAQRAALRGHRRPARRPRSAEGVPYPCFSRCPPKPKRMAESTWSAKSASPRELKRS